MKNKEIHFYAYDDNSVIDIIYDYIGTDKAIRNNQTIINTTQMSMLSCDLFLRDYRVIIHDSPDDSYEIKLGEDNTRTKRIIRIGHNLFNLWRGGEFNI